MKFFQMALLCTMLSISVNSEWYEDNHKLIGHDFLQGIQDIIGSDPNVPKDQIPTKPFGGSFSTIQSPDDPNLNTTSYCLTDDACGHYDAYSSRDVPLSLLGCNIFCYIDKDTREYQPSQEFDIEHPPASYLNCGWETCG